MSIGMVVWVKRREDLGWARVDLLSELGGLCNLEILIPPHSEIQLPHFIEHSMAGGLDECLNVCDDTYCVVIIFQYG